MKIYKIPTKHIDVNFVFPVKLILLIYTRNTWKWIHKKGRKDNSNENKNNENLPSTLAATVDCGRDTVVISTIPTITSTVIFLMIISTTSMPLSLPQKAILMPFMTPWWPALDIPKLVFFPFLDYVGWCIWSKLDVFSVARSTTFPFLLFY